MAFQQRPWSPAELIPLLQEAGFKEIEHWRAEEDLLMEGHYGQGRCYMRGVNGKSA